MDISQLFLSYIVSVCMVSSIRKNSGVSKKVGGVLTLERDKTLNGKKVRLFFVVTNYSDVYLKGLRTH